MDKDHITRVAIDSASLYAALYGLDEFLKLEAGLYNLGIDPKIAMTAYSAVVDMFFKDQADQAMNMLPFVSTLSPQVRLALFKSLVVMVIDLGAEVLNPQRLMSYVRSVGAPNAAAFVGSNMLADMVANMIM